ncbi:cytochrome c oxidase assembly protein [Actinomycetospora termitidis]|uniref:Cytochrome c oxidase assembly protein n=1 Tax=Actinomycetospora termitidis TaxID=3053470 RepID=A0ABT7MCC3_9PSEU|nr:cytochrome c oxidase assembly protein [Actinomycetospora sp. Odt1-22]MDL5158111.1 cytochrome c oxidase assembly protein [Actinomycetospora sp. Odt1-22]
MRRLLPALAAGLVTVLVAALLLGRSAYPVLGLADPGELVQLGVPLLRALAAGAAAVVLGALVHGLVVVPGTPSATVRGVASGAAWAWAVLAFGTAVFTVADVSGGFVAPGPDLVVGMVVRAAPVGWLACAVGAAVVAVWVREARTWSSSLGAGVLACVSLLGPVMTGHAIDGVGKDLGTPAVALHVIAATVWLGTIGAQLVAPVSPARSGAVSTVCAVVTIASGVLASAVLVPSWGELATAYGVLVLAAAAVTVVVLGVLVRRRLTGSTALVVTELALLAVVTALSVAMTRAVPPVQAPFHTTPTEAMLGFRIPDPPTVGRLLTEWRLDVWFAALAVVLVVVYARWLRRVEGWPLGRSVSWFAGCALLVVATSSGIGRYADALYSVHVAEHMLISIVVPVLLVLGAPITLARRALPDEGDTQRSGAGPSGTDARDRLEAALDAPLLRLLTHPAVAAVVMVGSPFAFYLTPLFSLLQPLGWLMPAISLWFLTAGVLFFWVIIGVDPVPGRELPHVARLAVLIASMPFHALFGAILLAADTPVAQTPSTLAADGGGGQVFVTDFYSRLRLPWAPDLLADQHVAALLSWGMGDLPLVGVLVILLVQWHRASVAEDAAARDLLAARR